MLKDYLAEIVSLLVIGVMLVGWLRAIYSADRRERLLHQQHAAQIAGIQREYGEYIGFVQERAASSRRAAEDAERTIARLVQLWAPSRTRTGEPVSRETAMARLEFQRAMDRLARGAPSQPEQSGVRARDVADPARRSAS